MAVIDATKIKPDSITKGFKDNIGLKQYVICKHGNRIICYFYSGDAGETLINHYLKNNKIRVETTKLERKVLKDNADELTEMLDKKIVILDKMAVLYGDVVELSKTTKIKGYTEGELKNNFNVFTTI